MKRVKLIKEKYLNRKYKYLTYIYMYGYRKVLRMTRREEYMQ